MAKRYNPQERLDKSPAGRDTLLPPGRVAWTRVDWLDVVQSRLASVPDRDADDATLTDPDMMEKHGTEHIISLVATKGRGGITINLSKFTEPELEVIKEIIDRVFAEARDECRRRDVAAQEAYEHGEDSFARLYRQVPRVIYRKGEEPPHGSGVHSGPPGIAGVGRSGDASQ